MRIYISGPLQGARDIDVARRFYDEIAAIVEGAGCEAYVPHHFTDPIQARSLSASSVFASDLAALSAADAVIAHIGLPSTGVGAELALAAASHRKVLGLKRPGEPGSRFAEGLILDAGGSVITFGASYELESEIRRWLHQPHGWFGQPHSIHLHSRAVA
ncbi:hypothetical protein ASF79_15845 [Agreia sp. Leaf335]|uniref:nucleoside 2-deoxyribosyltransferase n=1 Tax=Agreia sp. Leaf335 TaxID=1736340 RepID=UPI0006FF2A8C|nr:nucleoside 2-deoxyribosyltransferase [Agreia sp. Leaf335]KQR19141.1 hypothetical protein ASF79_15845 [Agreia sp. Leaf335]